MALVKPTVERLIQKLPSAATDETINRMRGEVAETLKGNQ